MLDDGFDERWPAEGQILYLNLCEKLADVDWTLPRAELIRQVAELCADAIIETARDSGGEFDLAL